MATTKTTNTNTTNINILKKTLFDKLYSRFNEPQREAIYHVNGPLLVLAGAGTGKTTVLVNRIAHIVRYGNAMAYDHSRVAFGADTLASLEAAESGDIDTEALRSLLDVFAVEPAKPWQILAITFTNKAAGEIKSRLKELLGEAAASEVWAGTFHSVCVRILRRHGEAIGVPKNFTIYDADDSRKLVSIITHELGLDEKVYAAKMVAGAISAAKEKLQGPEEYVAQSNARDPKIAGIGNIYKKYQAYLKNAAALDFDDLIGYVVRLFTIAPEVAEFYTRRFKYVCVDEYQDTNKAQFVLTDLISRSGNLMAVGDDDQSIYRFRGATIENILGFENSFAGTAVVKLEENYRSTSNILNAANAVIAHNKSRHGKTLWSGGETGEPVFVKGVETQREEANFIAEHIKKNVGEGGRYNDFAILYRMNATSGSLEPAFTRLGIPYRIYGGLRFFDRKEVKDIMSYLSLINNPADDLRLRRIINEPKRKIGETTLGAVEAIATVENKSLFEVICDAGSYIPLSQAAPRLVIFSGLMQELIAAAAETPLPELVALVMEKSGYLDVLKAAGDTETDRVANLGQLVTHAAEFAEDHPGATLEDYLEDAALMSEADNYDRLSDTVAMMTIHAAKGMEFNSVFLPAFEKGIFPSSQSDFDPPEREEERRLAYVALTRARKNIVIVHAKERSLFGHTQYNPPSPFINEIPSEYKKEDVLARPQTKRRAVEAETDYQIFLREKTARQVEEKANPTTAEGIFAGESVSHATFGQGRVLSVTPMGADIMYEIAFDSVGTKKLMGKYAKLKKIHNS